MNTTDKENCNPAIFISHGSPMVALENGPYQEALADLGTRYLPNAIVVVSAHWVSGDEMSIKASPRLASIHDFGGFPRRLYEMEYNAPGSPSLAKRIESLLTQAGSRVVLDSSRGLDHGAWVPLRIMYPQANVPVVQLSLPLLKTPEELYGIGKILAPLRKEEIMILGSGGIVHNLARIDSMNRDRTPEPWAKEFDQWIADRCENRNFDELFQYREKAPFASLAVPTPEHFLPLFVTLGAGGGSMEIETIFEGFTYGTLSMRCFSIGN